MTGAILGQQIVNALALGSVYAMIAVGLAMIYGVLRILHIAHAGVYTAGAYLGLYFFQITGNFIVAVAGSMLTTGMIGAFIERAVYRPIIAKPRIVALITSIGLVICLSDLFRITAGPYQLPFDYPALAGEFRFLGISTPWVELAITGGSAAMFAGLWFFIHKTSIGLGIRAVAQDIEAAKMMGIDVNRNVQMVFFISSAVAAFGAIMVGVLYNAVYPRMGEMIGYKGLALVVIGGFGSMTGALISGFVLGFAETFVTTYLDVPLSREGIAMFMLVLMVMIRPQGLFGKRAWS